MTNATPAPTPPAHRRRAAWIALAAIALGLALLLWLWDWNWFKPLIERRVELATGRALHLDGDLDIDLGWTRATARVGPLRFANVAGAEVADMATADAAELTIRIWPLLGGNVLVEHGRLDRPRIRLERGARGQGNWMLDRPRRSDRRVEVGDLVVSDGTLTLQDARTRTDLSLRLDSVAPRDGDALSPLQIRGAGRYRGFDFSLTGRIESPLSLRDADEPYGVNLDARAGATRARARGNVGAMLSLDSFDLDVRLSGDDLADLHPLAGVALPPTPPYALRGTLRRRGDVWLYQDFSGRVGDSDLSGDATLTVRAPRPRLEATLRSKQLDFDDLGGFIGAPPETGDGERASPQQQRDAAALAADERVLPQRPYDVAKLRSMDADVSLEAPVVRAAPLPLDSLHGRLRLQDGVATLDPFTLGVAGGRVQNRIVLDASRDPIATEADITLRGLQLPRLFPDAKLTENSAGRIGGHLALTGRGNSIAAMLATADGEAGLVMGRGRISNLLLELAGLDVAEALKFMLGKDRIIPLRCAHAALVAEAGVMTLDHLAFDTTDTVLYGEGRIDLRDESLDLLLRPQPKDRSLVSLRSPLVVDGRFKDPDVRPKAGPLLLRGVAAAVLYSVAPPATLLALLETGPGEDTDCSPPAAPASDTGSP